MYQRMKRPEHRDRRARTITCHACALTAFIILVRYLDPSEPITKDPFLDSTAQLMVSRTE